MVTKGNEEADKLAKQGAEKKMKKVGGVLENVDSYFIEDKKGNLVETNTFRFIKKKGKGVQFEKMCKEKSRGKPFREGLVDVKKSMLPMKEKIDFGCEKDFIHKAKQGFLCNNKNLHERGKRKEKKYTEYLEKVYPNSLCTACAKKGMQNIDDRYHVYRCEAFKEEIVEMEKVMREEINKWKQGEPLEDFPWWFDN